MPLPDLPQAHTLLSPEETSSTQPNLLLGRVFSLASWNSWAHSGPLDLMAYPGIDNHDEVISGSHPSPAV